MLTLNDIRGYIAGSGVANSENVYIGRLDNKKNCFIGVYHRQGSSPPVMALSGYDYSSYDIRRISLLIRQDRDVRTPEQATYGLYEKPRNISGPSIGGTPINRITLQVPEPADVGTDDNGVYEHVIWLDFVYRRK